MKIVLLSKTRFDETEVAVVTSLFENGLDTYHLRKPKLSTRQVKQILDTFPKQFHSRIIIHSHHQLARKYNLKGVHYTRTHLRRSFKNWWRKITLGISKSDLIKTSSSTKLSSLYDDNEIEFDYVFLSPVFDSLTGKFQSGFYEDGIRAAINKSGKNIVARGGVDIRRLEKIKEIGFYGMALGSCIWESKEPLEEYLKIVSRCRELNIEIE
ncbi:MAG: thiamine monophosphate synthase [Bacteroidetes bacterium]|jgi:thiamine-phosphate pyrophosphorylase|nr:thiamine monophosphate synthase [Bacteroidota bacterium]